MFRGKEWQRQCGRRIVVALTLFFIYFFKCFLGQQKLSHVLDIKLDSWFVTVHVLRSFLYLSGAIMFSEISSNSLFKPKVITSKTVLICPEKKEAKFILMYSDSYVWALCKYSKQQLEDSMSEVRTSWEDEPSWNKLYARSLTKELGAVRTPES